MATYTPPTSFTTSHNTITSQSTTSSIVQSDINPSSLDTLPILAATFSRIQTNPLSTSLNPNGSPHPSNAQTQTQTQATSSSASSNASSAAVKDFKETFSTTPLTTKDIPAATDGLKHRLQKTRAQVALLPDMDRSIEEQEEEIRELEEKIKEQRRVLEQLKAIGSGEKMEI